MKNNGYALLLKTGDAELRALANSTIDNIVFPVIELTRGRKSKNDKIGLIQKRVDKLKSIFQNKDICLDLTTSSSLSNEEIDDLYTFASGYEKWIKFLLNIKNENVFKNIIPTILVNTEDSDFEINLKLQVSQLTDNFDSIVYRNSLADDGCYEDIRLIKDIIVESGKEFYFIVDCEYIAPGAWKSFSEKAKSRIKKIKDIVPTTKFIIVSTSFPKSVGEIGKEFDDTFQINEIDLYNDVCKDTKIEDIYYGDYGSINPIRNDDVIMSNGWRPRIDVALQDKIFYYREKRGNSKYSDIYTVVANRVIRDKRFPHSLTSSWGIDQIISCSNGNAPGSNPSFWISVRMNIHIEQQTRRLKGL